MNPSKMAEVAKKKPPPPRPSKRSSLNGKQTLRPNGEFSIEAEETSAFDGVLRKTTGVESIKASLRMDASSSRTPKN
jgi:hypothetical protein